MTLESQVQQTLAQIWSDVLGVASVGADDDFFSMGGDSLLSIQVVAKASARGIPLSYKMIFQSPTIRRLAASVETQHIAGAQQAAAGEVPLTPIQTRFFEVAAAEVDQWNQWVLLDLPSALTFDELRVSVAELFRVHDTLRLRFRRTEEGWEQSYVHSLERLPLEWVHATPASRELVIEETNRSLELETGVLIRLICLDYGASADRQLLVVAHHLVMDNVSFHLLATDLQACLSQCRLGAPLSLGPNSCTYKAWGEAQARAAREGSFDNEVEYWRAQLLPPARPISCDFRCPPGAGTYELMQSCAISFSEPQTATIIAKLPTLLHCRVNAIFLDALMGALYECFGVAETVVEIETHGRLWIDDTVDLRKATGWYTSIYPQRMVRSSDSNVHERIRRVDRQLGSVPNGGIGYGVLRYLSRKLPVVPNAEICFNYLGQVGRGTRQLAAFGSSHSKSLQRSNLLLIESAVVEGRLTIQCQYNSRAHEQHTIARLLRRMQSHLNSFILHLAAGFSRAFGKLTHDRDIRDVLDDVAVIYPLLGTQAGMLFQHLSRREGMQPYLVQVSCILRGELDTQALRKAWDLVIARHESLRTSIHWVGLDAPVQAVHRSASLSFRVIDGSEANAITPEKILMRDRAMPVSLDSSEPRMRVVILDLGGGRHFCLWSHHHIQLDGWSQLIVLRELFQVYRALVRSESPRLPPAASLGEYLRSLDSFPTDEAQRYWRHYLQGFREATPVARQGATGSAIRHMMFRLEASVSDAISAFAKISSLTLHTVFRAVWALWLAVHAERDDVVFGDVVAGRGGEMQGVEQLVGTLINTIPVRMLLEERIGTRDWLKRTQEEQAAAHRYELLPLTETMRLAETNKEGLLFDSILVFENLPGSYVEIAGHAGFELESIDFSIQENYPIVVTIRPEKEVIVKLNYREADVDARIGHFQIFLGLALEAFRQYAECPLLDCRNALAERYFYLLQQAGV